MSIAGIANNPLLSSMLNAQNTQLQNVQKRSGQNSTFQQIQDDFAQVGEDLQEGNLAQAQQDYTTLAAALPYSSSQGLLSSVTSNSASSGSSSSSPTGSIQQDMSAVGGDLQSGNLNAAQEDFATLEQAMQRARNGQHGHHFHGHTANQNSQATGIQNELGALGQALQSGSLSGAQSAFASLQQNLQSFASSGFAAWSSAGGTSLPGGVPGTITSGASLSPSGSVGSSLNVTG